MDIKGKVALVLGAVKGIGKGIGLDLARQGAS
ncbi:MAG TPA: 3-oxoacyl-ACP reductase, partial [Desulfobacter sp.]|nr:3-oxoacyl-ACP reductase [Desulfobacter sp.]